MAKRFFEKLYPYESAKRIKLISNNCGYGPCPDKGEEIEQRLTFRPDGQVWLSGHGYTDLGGMGKLRSERFTVDAGSTERIIRGICAHFAHDCVCEEAMDVGGWELEITGKNDERYLYRGPLCKVTDAFFQETSNWMRKAIRFDLFAFDGDAQMDRVNYLAFEYNRVTKIETNEVFGNDSRYATWHYGETLRINRTGETITHKQRIGTGCDVTKTYHVEEGVEDFLDGLNVDTLFRTIPELPEDVVEDPLETKTYRLIVEFEKRPKLKLHGIFDAWGLPTDWGEFASKLRSFLTFYGFGEIFDPYVYKKARHRTNALVFCSVEFEEGGKTYYYLADEDIYEIGDRVLVPVRNEGHTEIVEIVEKEYFDEADAPFPLDRIKHIIRKVEEGEGDSVYCPVLERGIDDADCMEICDVADDMSDETVMDTFDPPVQWTEELAEKCRNCEHRF